MLHPEISCVEGKIWTLNPQIIVWRQIFYFCATGLRWEGGRGDNSKVGGRGKRKDRDNQEPFGKIANPYSLYILDRLLTLFFSVWVFYPSAGGWRLLTPAFCCLLAPVFAPFLPLTPRLIVMSGDGLSIFQTLRAIPANVLLEVFSIRFVVTS